MTNEELDFKGANLIQCKKWDNFLMEVVRILAKSVRTNGLMAAKTLKRYIRLSQLLKRIYIPEVNNEVFKPNIRLVESLYLASNKNEVDLRGEEFGVLLSKVMDIYFKEYEACLLVVSKLLKDRVMKQVFRDLAQL